MSAAADERFLVVDVGSTTTKAVLFRKRMSFEMVRREAPTTVEAPDMDVTIGLLGALRALEAAAGEPLLDGDRPRLPLFVTSSAGGGLAMVVTGLVKTVTSRSAELAALGAGAILLDTIALDDGRAPWRKVEAMRRVRPDLLLFAGGFDGGAISGPVLLAELTREADLRPKLDPSARLPVLYAGNEDARQLVEETLGDRVLFRAVENLRPESDREQLEPARRAILEVFHEHVMSHAPGYPELARVSGAPVLPTPSAVSVLLEIVSRDLPGRTLVVDVGGATTDVFTAAGGRVLRTVSANLGMSYSALHVLRSRADDLAELLPDMDPRELADRIGEKHVRPTRLPLTEADVRVERALAAAAVRGAVREHLAILNEVSLSRDEEQLSLRSIGRRTRGRREPGPGLALTGYDLVIGSGGALSHPPREATAEILVNALRPEGVVRLGVDRAFVFPHLGILGKSRPDLAAELFREIGFVPLGTIVAPGGKGRSRRARLSVSGSAGGRKVDRKLAGGEVAAIPLAADELAELTVRTRVLDLREREVRAPGGAAGLLFDARGRPPVPPRAGFFPEDLAPPPPREESAREPAVETGTLAVPRELAVPGEVLVSPGSRVEPDTPVCRSSRTFPRPFFVPTASVLGVDPVELPDHLLVAAGDQVESGEEIARVSRPFLGDLVVRSPATGRVERLLPDGRVVVREEEERASDVRPVEVARELGVRTRDLAGHLTVATDDEVEEGQALARVLTGSGYRAVPSPIRGRVTHVDLEFGIVLVAPLAEELTVAAGLPGVIARTTPRGAVVEGRGVRVRGLFGTGEEALGPLRFTPVGGGIFVAADPPPDLDSLAGSGIAGLITGGLPLAGLLDSPPPFPVVLTEGFGRRPLPEAALRALRPHRGHPALIDGRTELRAGVRRPFVAAFDDYQE